MRVLYVKDRFTVHDRRFLQAIIEQGHTPFLARTGSGEGDRFVSGTVAASPPEALGRLAESLNVDVAHIGPMHVAGTVAASLPSALPMVAVSWGSDILRDCGDEKARRLAYLALGRADAVIADCSAVCERIRTWFPNYATPIVTFPWGIDVGQYHDRKQDASSQIRARLGWTENTVFISTRTWEPAYGIDILINAFARVVAQMPQARLLLAGSGSLATTLQTELKQRGLSAYVHAPGALEEKDLPVWYGVADVYVSSSPCDGSSVSLLEAMASSKPVVAHYRFGNIDWVEHEQNGWLVDCRDEQALASVMMQAIESRMSWDAMGQRGRARVLKNADWRENCRQISQAFQLAVDRRATQ